MPVREFDLDAHPLFRSLPARAKLGLRSYLGVPLFRSDDTVWGTLAATDTTPRETTDAHLEMLVILARLAIFEFEREEQKQVLADRLKLMEAFADERLRAVRLEAVLEAAATVCHEINNPLTVLRLRLERMSKRAAGADPATLDDVEVALEAAEQIAQVTVQLRNVVQPVSTCYVAGNARMIDLAASLTRKRE